MILSYNFAHYSFVLHAEVFDYRALQIIDQVFTTQYVPLNTFYDMIGIQRFPQTTIPKHYNKLVSNNPKLEIHLLYLYCYVETSFFLNHTLYPIITLICIIGSVEYE